jgi:hypothetical protein
VTMILIAFVVLVLFVTAFVVFFSRLFTRVDDNESTAEWLNEFSIESYRPMERLFNEADYEFLAEQPGYHPGIAKKLRAERKMIFRSYLRQLAGDFHRLVHVANLMMVYSGDDRSDLAHSIFRLRVRFYWTVVCTEASLSLGPVVPIRPVHARQLIAALSTMHANVHQLAPMQSGA